MVRTRRFLMVAMVATAISADRLVASAPSLRPQVSQAARSIAGRLVVNLRRTIPAARMVILQRQVRPMAATSRRVVELGQLVYPVAFSPFQYRLPPPAV